MDIRPSSTALLVALVCVAPPLLAQQPSSPPAELEQLSLFVGTWKCSGQMLGDGSHPAHPTSGAGRGARAVGDSWVRFAYDEAGGSGATPYSVAGFFGYDAGRKQFVQTIVDNYGGYLPSFSEGWRGDTLTFEGKIDAPGQNPTVVRDTFVRKGPHAFLHFTQIRTSDGTWIKPGEEDCRVTG